MQCKIKLEGNGGQKRDICKITLIQRLLANLYSNLT